MDGINGINGIGGIDGIDDESVARGGHDINEVNWQSKR
jgi:hypothetical protein